MVYDFTEGDLQILQYDLTRAIMRQLKGQQAAEDNSKDAFNTSIQRRKDVYLKIFGKDWDTDQDVLWIRALT